jgi:hypothetical protein
MDWIKSVFGFLDTGFLSYFGFSVDLDFSLPGYKSISRYLLLQSNVTQPGKLLSEPEFLLSV